MASSSTSAFRFLKASGQDHLVSQCGGCERISFSSRNLSTACHAIEEESAVDFEKSLARLFGRITAFIKISSP
jgi:hypothetical protein